MIPIKIKTTGAVMLSDEVERFVDEKVQKLSRFLEDDTTALAEIELESLSGNHQGNMYRVEMNLSFSGELVRAEAKRETLHAAVDQAVSEARRELRSKKTKHRDLLRHGAARVKDFFKQFGS